MIEKFTKEELAIIIQELKQEKMIPTNKDKSDYLVNVYAELDVLDKDGNRDYLLDSRTIKDAIFVLADWATANYEYKRHYSSLRRRIKVPPAVQPNYGAFTSELVKFLKNYSSSTRKLLDETHKEQEHDSIFY